MRLRSRTFASRGAETLRRCSFVPMIWAASLTLGAADVLYARLVPGPPALLHALALALAAAAGLIFCVAAAGAVLRRRGWRRAVAARLEDVIAREAEWGIAQIEAWLARQDHSRDG